MSSRKQRYHQRWSDDDWKSLGVDPMDAGEVPEKISKPLERDTREVEVNPPPPPSNFGLSLHDPNECTCSTCRRNRERTRRPNGHDIWCECRECDRPPF